MYLCITLLLSNFHNFLQLNLCFTESAEVRYISIQNFIVIAIQTCEILYAISSVSQAWYRQTIYSAEGIYSSIYLLPSYPNIIYALYCGHVQSILVLFPSQKFRK